MAILLDGLVDAEIAYRADVASMDALATLPAPQRLHVVRPSGAGKTSLILRAVAAEASR